MNLPKSLGLVGVALATLGTASAAQAALVVVPPSLAPGAQYRLVFVTNTTTQATSTDINDYNTNPSSAGVPIYLINGNLVANNNADLWDGSIATPIDRTPDDAILPFFAVWTGTLTPGFAEFNAYLGADRVNFGNSSSALATWVDGGTTVRGSLVNMYAMSDVLTKPYAPPPAVTVPEPTSVLGYRKFGLKTPPFRVTEGGLITLTF
jgi:hypothetical protein